MKIWLLILAGLLIFSGCSTKSQNYKLRIKNSRQTRIIQQQEAEIKKLRAKLHMSERQNARSRGIRKSRIILPRAPKKNITLKKVEDSNYSSSYMYPGAKKKPITPKKVVAPTIPVETSTSQTPPPRPTFSGMTKTECISMIGADKFEKYTQMFGSESASLKRCKMLKAMKQ